MFCTFKTKYCQIFFLSDLLPELISELGEENVVNN